MDHILFPRTELLPFRSWSNVTVFFKPRQNEIMASSSLGYVSGTYKFDLRYPWIFVLGLYLLWSMVDIFDIHWSIGDILYNQQYFCIRNAYPSLQRGNTCHYIYWVLASIFNFCTWNI